MRNRLLTLTFSAFFLLPAVATEKCGPAFDGVQSGGQGFQLYDGLSHTGKPDLSKDGFKKAYIVDRGIWGKGEEPTPNTAMIQSLVATWEPGAAVVLDFEQFKLNGSDEQVRASMVALQNILAAIKKQAPGHPYGHYGVLPLRDYWRAIAQNKAAKPFKDWQGENERMAPIGEEMDLLFPSLYTFYPDREGWKRFAVAQICEARRISKKPVIPFLWPEYHDSAKGVNDRFLPAAYWREQLELLYKYADGVVIWGGYDIQNKRLRAWDPNSLWWQETVAFIKAHQLEKK